MSRNKNKVSKSSDLDDYKSGTDLSVFLTVFSYCILIIILPVVTFFFSKHLFENILSFTSITSNIYAAVSAVICLHVALGVYLFKAYSEGDKSKPSHQVKQD